MRHTDYLMERDGVWYLRFRVPTRFGGNWVKVSLKTSDVNNARRIRDKYVRPILAADSACEVYTAIIRQLQEIGEEMPEHLGTLPALIAGGGDTLLSWRDAADKYSTWLQQSGAARKTAVKYSSIAAWLAERLGEDEPVTSLSKSACIKVRDELLAAKKSNTTVMAYVMVAKGWMSWLGREGLADGERLRGCWKIDLPAVRKQNTKIIPPASADLAERCLPEWQDAPRIARYTGMRLNEIIAACGHSQGCGIIDEQGVLCFSLAAEMTKTHRARLVPVPAQLMEIVRNRARLAAIVNRGVYLAKRYNIVLKNVPGCEACSMHSWRVYANTMMMEAGVDENLRRRALGHADSKDVHYGYSAGRLEAIKAALEKIP